MASHVVLFGGSGKVARHITRLLATEGHNVYSIIRNPAQKADVESLGGKPLVQSIEESSVEDMTKNHHRLPSQHRHLERRRRTRKPRSN